MNTNYKSLILAISLFFALSAPISAAPGDLDLTFSGDGKLLDWLSRGDDNARGVAIQPDGKIVVVGISWSELGGYDFAVARYNLDGSLDTTFGTGGKVTTDFNSSHDQAYSVAIQPDGKIVLAGSDLVRYNSDGSLDTTFGIGGRVTTANITAYSVAIHPNGKIVAAGTSIINGNGDFGLVRYNPDGSLDTSFDTDGKVTTDIFNLGWDSAFSVAIHTNGKIVAAGQGYDIASARSYFTLVQYNVDGSLDSLFDGDGKVSPNIGLHGRANSVAIQPDGKIVAVGENFRTFNSLEIVGFRFNTNGSIDGQWGTNLTIPGFRYARGQSVAVQPDGKIVTVGQLESDPSYSLVIMRSNADLSADLTFGNNGVSITPVDSYAWNHSHAIQPDGKIVIAREGRSPSDIDFAVFRFNSNGSLDTSFDGDGKVTTDFGFFQGNALRDTAIQPDGRIVAVGEARGDFAVLRYNPDGSLDTTFGSGTGKVRTVMRSYDGAGAVAIQTDGKVVAAGGSLDGDGNGCGFALARYNSDGSLDTTFGAGGRVDTGCYYGPPGYRNSFGALDIAIQPDGKIVAASGGDWSDSQKIGFLLIRFNPNGSLDTTFDGDGIVITEMGSNAIATSVAIQSDGKIVAAGRNNVDSYYSASSFTLARYNPDGSLDTTFDADGKVTTVIGTSSDATSVAIQSDGKIVAAGRTYTFGSNTEIAVVRYNPNGSLDATFNSDGIVTTAIGPGSDKASSVAIDGSGKLVVAGTSSGDFALASYNPNGSLDTTFGGGDGISTVDFGTSNDQANGMALDSQGRAVVVGVSSNMFAIARFLGDPRPTCPNPIDCPEFFVRQHYRDFLGREAETVGLEDWQRVLANCPSGDLECFHQARLTVSAAFFGSPEFQLKGYFAFRFYRTALNRLPLYSEIISDIQSLNGQTPADVYARRAAFANSFAQRSEFVNRFASLSNADYVAALLNQYGVATVRTPPPSLPDDSTRMTFSQIELTALLNSGTLTRAQVLRAVADSDEVFQLEFNRAFVAMQYYGYLRRTPEPDGFNNWLNYLNAHPTDYREMVRGFVDSVEYRNRFAMQ